MEIKGRNFLVIGGAGFIGSHLVEQLLDAGARHVRIFDNFSRGNLDNLKRSLSDPRAEVFTDGGDILHRDILEHAMQGMDGVFHLAALWLLQCVEYPRAAFRVNIEGTFNVIGAAIEAGARRIVFSSSASVYGDAIVEPMTEDHPFACREFYGATKVSGEVMLRALYHRYRNTPQEFDYVGLRYMNVYGPRQDDKGAYVGVIMKMLAAIESGQTPIIYGDGTQSYDFIDVRDCARANLMAMASTATDRFYNVGSGSKTNIFEVAELLLRMTGSTLTASFEPGDRTWVRSRIGSTERARMEINFETQIGLEEGLRELIQWYRTEHSSKGEGGLRIFSQ
jgi:UDP-glucose 4-epimerase